ncbi:calcium-binding protein [Thiobacillus sp.]
MKAKTKKTTKFTAKYLDKLIEEATTDAYNESEQAGGFFAMLEENLSLPFTTQVLGQEVTVAKVDITGRDQIVAICVRGKSTQAIPILDLPMPHPPPEGAEWIDAYRRWYGS